MFAKIGVNKNGSTSFEDPLPFSKPQWAHTTNFIAEGVYATGRALTKPFLRELSHATRLFGPHSRPGKAYDGVDYGPAWKWTMRVLHTAELITLFIPTFILAVCGVALKCLVIHFKPKAMLLKSEEDFKQYTKGDEIHLMTYNVGLMPSFIRNVNGLRSSMVRAEELVAEFQAQQEDKVAPDIICFQECFDHDATRILIEGLSEIYPHILYNVAPNDAGFSSGLVVVSKYKINSYSYRCFDNAKHEDKIPNKGLLGVKLQLSDDHEALVYNTHLQSKYDDPDQGNTDFADVRETQLQHIQGWIDKDVGEENEYEGIFFSGDLNVSRVYDGNYAGNAQTGQESGEYVQAMDTLGEQFTDTFYQTHEEDQTRTQDTEPRFLEVDCGEDTELVEPVGSWYQRVELDEGSQWGQALWSETQTPLEGAILDHILVHSASNLKIAETEVRHFGARRVSRSGLSDHLPVSAVFGSEDASSDSSSEESGS